MKSTRTFITGFVVYLMLLLTCSNIFNRHPSVLDPPNVTTTGSDNPKDTLQGGLLAKEFDQSSCLSRYQSSLYRKPSPYKPSLDLISKLRSYERLHKRCAPGTESYKRATEKLDHRRHDKHSEYSSGEQCRYIVWVPMYGLGNRILSLVSVFLYALMTERVILVDQRNDIKDLFCEPFPGTSLLLPLGHPLTNQLDGFNWRSPHSSWASINKLLPEAYEEPPLVNNISKKNPKPKLRAVLVTSLNPEYSNNLKRVYWEHMSSTGDIIGVYQASQEMREQRNKTFHNQKALAEMYLLSLTDNIVTSAWSTFGYVAQGLGGKKPWILYKPENYTVPPDPPCGRATSMEPCFHSPPPFDGCKADAGGTDDAWNIGPFVRHCEDRVSGIKLFDYPQ